MCSFEEKYTIIAEIGEGSFSQVFKVRDQQGQFLAAKKLLRKFASMDEVWQVNELQAIRKMDSHPNVIGIVDIIFEQPNGTLYLISELFDMNLYEYVKDRKRHLSEARCKHFLYQMVKGLHHLHTNGLFHRDIKPENILIRTSAARLKFDPDRAAVIQLADLGSVTSSTKTPPHSAYISTRWYRAPESLLTAGYYGPKIDIWALGCVFYELLTLKPLFPGDSELDQLTKIHSVLGVPTERTLRRFRHASHSYEFPRKLATGLHNLVPALSAHGFNLLEQTLHYAPEGRTTTMKLIEHGYFNDLRNHDQKIHRAFSSSSSLQNSSRTSAGSLSEVSDVSSTNETRKTRLQSRAKRPRYGQQNVDGDVDALNLGRVSFRCGVSDSCMMATNGSHRQPTAAPIGPRRQTTSKSTVTMSGDVTGRQQHSQPPTEKKLRERMWGMNPGHAKQQIWQRILQKNRSTGYCSET